MQPVKWLRNPIVSGTAALVVLAVTGIIAALLYISPPGQETITFFTDDAASVRAGDEVRIAGVTVGSVKDLALEANEVRVRAQIDRTAFVGNKSQIQVRMLTVVGGYYVNLVSLGDRPLGDEPIPQERVIMPYSLIRTLTDASGVIQNINPQPINESLNQIQAGLTGDNVQALGAVIDAGNVLMSTIDRQRGQITNILNVTDEYIGALSSFRETFKEMVRKLAIIQQTLRLYSAGFGQALDGLGTVVKALGVPIGKFYDNHRAEFLEKVRNFLEKGRMWIERNGVIVGVLRRAQDHILRVLDAQDAPPAELLATDLCIPVAGSAC